MPKTEMTNGRILHAQRCKEHLDECRMCQRNIIYYAALPLPDITRHCEDLQPQRGRFSFGSLVREVFIDTQDAVYRGVLKNKSAIKHCIAAGRLLREFAAGGGQMR